MLNKDVCKKCFNRKYAETIAPWRDNAEYDWEQRGLVYCWWRGYYSIGDVPPEKCEYKLDNSCN